jgi:hypothetical protein
MSNPYQVVRDFETAISVYCGSKFAVAVTSCTSALLLCCAYLEVDEVEIPQKTYIGVGQSILNAGGKARFRDEDWSGIYQLKPYPIYDAARRMTSGMYIPETFMCLSLHITKILGVDQGGVILLDDYDAYEMLKRMRFDGRRAGVHPAEDEFVRGWHCYLSPNVAAQALWKLSSLPPIQMKLNGEASLSELQIVELKDGVGIGIGDHHFELDPDAATQIGELMIRYAYHAKTGQEVSGQKVLSEQIRNKLHQRVSLIIKNLQDRRKPPMFVAQEVVDTVLKEVL